ncbi:YjcZ family sporulation protein [Aeribacillus alveayuensis]
MFCLTCSKGGFMMHRYPGYAYPTYGYNRTFVLIVVLFILLIIVGAAYLC